MAPTRGKWDGTVYRSPPLDWMSSEPRGPSPLYLMAIETFMTPGDSSNMIKREWPIRSRPHPTGGKLRTRTPAFAGDASHPSSAEDVGSTKLGSE